MLKQKKYVYGEKKRNQLLEGVKRQKEQQTNKKSIMEQKGTIYVYAVQTKLENKRKGDTGCVLSSGVAMYMRNPSASLRPFLVCLGSAAHGEDSS